MYYDDHNPLHFHAEYGGDEALLIRELISKDDSGYKLYTVPSGTGKEVYLPVHGSVISIDTLDVIAGDLPSHALGTGFSFSSTMRQTARPNSAREAHRL
jgi:hypothetical protein